MIQFAGTRRKIWSRTGRLRSKGLHRDPAAAYSFRVVTADSGPAYRGLSCHGTHGHSAIDPEFRRYSRPRRCRARGRWRSAIVCFVKHSLGKVGAKSGLWKKWKTIKLFSIFPTTPAATAAGNLDFFQTQDDGHAGLARRCLTSRASAFNRTRSL